MKSQEQYLKPEVIQTIKRLDLRAQFIIKGFMHGLHASPLHGFSVEFSEHRKYTQGDDPSDIDWLVYAKTEKYYIKKYEAETNLTGYLAVDSSRSMGYTYRQEMTKFDYSVCLASALAYLMTHQQDPVGLITFDETIKQSLKPQSRRTQLGTILSVLSKLQPTGQTNIAASLMQLAAMLKRQSMIMVFSDLLGDADEILKALHRLRHSGHDVILFHILDEAETQFPFHGRVELVDPESEETIPGDAETLKQSYLDALEEFRNRFRHDCSKTRIDYVELDTSVQFDKALIEYLTRRSGRR
ncbi:MAG: DUF58 domain-containing protein [Planctomycetaceae bacterium]|jgi:uncharacterized protein (DUF58 family)|nr:DUF58 domain-containing protein [Planctomycetaceae bacterium]